MDNNESLYIIKEQGELGLFADEISEEDQKKIDENFENTNKKE